MFQPTVVYSDFLIKENVFSQGQFSSQHNKRSTWISLTFLTIFELSEVSTITVRSMKKIPDNDFSQQRNKEKSLSLLIVNVSWVIWHGKSWGLCQEVFKKQLLIIKVWLFLQKRVLKYSTRNSQTSFVLV